MTTPGLQDFNGTAMAFNNVIKQHNPSMSQLNIDMHANVDVGVGVHPILSMPPEILEKIFLYLLYEEERQHKQTLNRAPLIISAVCRSWRLTAHATPSLWKHITVSYSLINTVDSDTTVLQADAAEAVSESEASTFPPTQIHTQAQVQTQLEHQAYPPPIQSDLLRHFVSLAGNRIRLDLFYAGIDSEEAFNYLSMLLLQDDMFYKVETLRIFADNCPFIEDGLSLWAIPLDGVKHVKIQSLNRFKDRNVDMPPAFFEVETLHLRVYSFIFSFATDYQPPYNFKLQVLRIRVTVITDEELVTVLVSSPNLRHLSVIAGLDIPNDTDLPQDFIHPTLEELIINYAPKCLAFGGTFPSLQQLAICLGDYWATKVLTRIATKSQIHSIGIFDYGSLSNEKASLLKSFHTAKRLAIYARPETMSGTLLTIGTLLATRLPWVEELDIRDSVMDKDDPLTGDFLVRCIKAREMGRIRLPAMSSIKVVYHGMRLPQGLTTTLDDMGIRLERTYEDA